MTSALLKELSKLAKGIEVNSLLLTLGGGVALKQELLTQQLAQAAKQVGFVDVISLDKILEKYKGRKDLFFPKDGHWTATAIEFVTPIVTSHIMAAFEQESVSQNTKH